MALVRVLCSNATESMADLVSQLIPTLTLCSSVGNRIRYAIFLAAIGAKQSTIGKKENSMLIIAVLHLSFCSVLDTN